jgi:adenosine kinase
VSTIITPEEEIEVAPVKAETVKDPTGCGDAYRAGLIHGFLNDLDLVTTCRIGSVMGAIKIEQQGPQNHAPSTAEIEERFLETYGYRF